MKLSIFIAVSAFSLALPVYAQNNKNSSTKTIKTKITCSYNSEFAYKTEGDAKFSDVESDKGGHSVAIRTSRYENGVEYRSSEYKGFDENGNLHLEGHSTIKVVTEKVGDKLIESSDMVINSRLVPDGFTYENRKKTKQTIRSTRSVYQLSGNERVLLEYEENGVSKPTNGQRTSIFQEGDRRIENTVVNPHSEKHGNFEVKTLKEQYTCIYEDLK